MRISIILPFPATKPVGGAKIMYEYANRLSARGHDVTVYHSIKRPYKKSSTPTWIKKLIFTLRGVERPKWFALHENIKSVIVPSITGRYIRDADIIISTWWQMTYAVSELPASKGKKFNLIQDYETWGGQQDKVDASYYLPVQHLAIARYLQDLVEEKTGGYRPIHIPNAIDEEKFGLDNPIGNRKPGTIIMLYSEEPRKGTSYGLEALKQVHALYPELRVQFFGVYPTPSGLPDWISYIQRPGNLRQLYNEASVFISPSLGEGWALPPAEAMACGCAVVCTRIGGHLDYAIDRQSALLIEKENPAQLAERILELINHDSLRQQIAENGNHLIRHEFSWQSSVSRLEECFSKALEK